MTTFTETPEARKAKRERARKLIRDLLAKTTANGCTEEEAAKAAAKASELMAQYDLTMADAQDVKDDVYGAAKKSYRNNNHEIVRFCGGAVGEFCDCKCFSGADYVCYFGAQHDTEVAHYLLDLLINTANAEWKAFYKTNGGATAKSRRGFFLGFAVRINQRLKDIRKAREDAVPQTGTALVVVKAQVVAERYRTYTQGMRFSRSRGLRSAGTRNAYDAGIEAGTRTNITTGVHAQRAGRLEGS